MITKTYQEIINNQGVFIGLPVGKSMWPMLRSRIDTVKLIKITRPLKKYDVILYQRQNGEYVLHRIIKVKPHSYVLCGDNQWQKEEGITIDMIIAVMDGFYRKEKYYSVNNFIYKLYYHFWCLIRPIRKLIYYIKRLFSKVFKVKK